MKSLYSRLDSNNCLSFGEILAEPYRIKTIERVRVPSYTERKEILKKASYSIVHIDSSDVYIDLVTDSGTGAMSDQQWAALMKGDEAYFRSKSFLIFQETVQKITGYPHIIPTHQGRAAENILMELMVKPGDVVLSNTFFDTTRAHVQNRGGLPLDLIGDELWDFAARVPFKGNFDLAKLKAALARFHEKVPFILITVLNNLACSSPVSMENIRAVAEVAKQYKKPIFFDACRFSENAYLIKTRESGYEDKSTLEIALEMFSYGEGCHMSAKKDGLSNIGGFIAVKNEEFMRKCQEKLVLYEGFSTYGGLAGRDLEAIAIGLNEGLDEDYLKHRIAQVAYLANGLEKVAGIVVSQPSGGSGVFVDVKSVYPHLSNTELPEIALACDLYIEGGVRAGSAPFLLNLVDPKSGEVLQREFQFARLALPRRVYTKGHLDYVIQTMRKVKENSHRQRGYRVTYAPEVLAHFFAKFEPLL